MIDMKAVVFALDLVARALEGRTDTDPESSNGVTTYTLDAVADDIRDMIGKLDSAPAQAPGGAVLCEPIDDRWSSAKCVYHPLGGPDCAFE